MITKVYRLHIRCDHYPCGKTTVYDGAYKSNIPKDWYQKYNPHHQLTMHYCPEHGVTIPGAQLGNPPPIEI